MKRSLRILIWLGVCLALVSCTTLPLPGVSGKVLQSKVQRINHPDVPDGDLQSLVAGNTAFALDFYQVIRSQPGNLFYSPYSLSLVLAMAYGGARGETASQMADALNFSLQPEKLHTAFNALDLSLRAAGAGGTVKGENSAGDEVGRQLFQLHIVNSIWGQEGYPFQAEFLDLLAQQYGAGMRLVDYQHNPDRARRGINTWVGRDTQNRIRDLIPPGALDEQARLTLVNAIYFKADWKQPFDFTETRDLPFHLLDGGTVQARGMRYEQPRELPYFAGEDFQAVSLPYQGDRVAMLVIVPDAGQDLPFEKSLNGEQVQIIQKGMQPTRVNLVLPKFQFSADYELANILAQLGMQKAFDPNRADFSGIDGTKNLYIQQVFHKTFVAVDEEGTEAAAATGIVFRDIMGRLPGKVELIVDRPFLFFIYDQPTGTLLFAGRVVNPTQ